MDDADTTTPEEMQADLFADIEALVAAGELDAVEAADMLEWLGTADAA